MEGDPEGAAEKGAAEAAVEFGDELRESDEDSKEYLAPQLFVASKRMGDDDVKC